MNTTMKPCDPKWFDIKLNWASKRPGFACKRDGTTLEYWLDGQPLLRVVKNGAHADLYAAEGPPQLTPAPHYK